MEGCCTWLGSTGVAAVLAAPLEAERAGAGVLAGVQGANRGLRGGGGEGAAAAKRAGVRGGAGRGGSGRRGTLPGPIDAWR